ncbi:MAG: hypothetical protein K2N28_05190 [Muribaculaceae bacterium]|nr:hypothetical protein [Muribaculaceae bacterium]
MKITDIFSLKQMIHASMTLAMCLTLAACQDDTSVPEEPINENSDGIVFRCTDMVEAYHGEGNIASRASSPKDEFEKQIKTLHVFFFNQETGDLMATTNYDNFKAYMKKDNGFLKIPTPPAGQSLFVGGDDVEVRIVAIANIDATETAADATDSNNTFYTKYSENGKIAKESRDKGAAPYEITSYDDITKWTYYPRLRIDEETGLGDIRNLPAAGMPMIGELEHVKLNQKSPYVVNMTALMAKIRVSVKLDPDQFDDNKALPELMIDEIGILNMPVAVPYIAPKGEKPASKPIDYADYLENCDVTKVSMVHPGTERDDEECAPELHEYVTKLPTPIVVTRKTDPAIFTYYTYENIQLPDYNAKRTNGSDAFNGSLDAQYPSGVTDSDKQRWKSTLAYKNRASAIILKGTFTNHQEVDYRAQFTAFIGENADDDFKVRRNFQYDNNITVYGLEYIRNSDDGVYIFDGRVNVVSDNPIYLAIVNERKVDAHATALPLSVWLMMWENANNQTEGAPDVNWRSEVKLSIREPESHKWIRIGEVIPRATMAANNWASGTGARDYFTTDLVTDELADVGKSRTITSEDGSRSRVYFYIDENVPENNDVNTTDPNADNYYGDRYATVDVNYKRFSKSTGELVEERDYTLDIEQRALLKVSGQHSSGNNVPDTWMEYYEEYLDHNDPLDKHEMPGELYSGLKWWRVTGVRATTGNRNEDDYVWKIYTKNGAFDVTKNAVNNTGTANINSIKLFNTVEPESVFHYCYGKNKRNSDGTVPDNTSKGWYTPGIREMERALVLYYDKFETMRNIFYWSASPAGATIGIAYENTDEARATRVTLGTNGSPQYTESGNSGTPGRQSRTNINRVRAFYRVD